MSPIFFTMMDNLVSGSQLSIEACPNILLPKTLMAHQVWPNTTEHLPGLVTSNYGPQ